MIKNIQYIRIHEVLSRVLRHRLLLSVTLEAAVLYTLDFIHAVGVPDMFMDKEAIITINGYKGTLPCDLVSINQVMDTKTNQCLRSMTDTFMPTEDNTLRYRSNNNELTFKTLNTVIITSFKEGEIKISYKATPIDEEGYPLLIDNPTYLKALELYILLEVFTDKYYEGTMLAGVLLNALQLYAWKVGLLLSEMTIPSESEMESLCRSWCTLLPRTTEFDNGWKNLGNREYNKIL